MKELILNGKHISNVKLPLHPKLMEAGKANIPKGFCRNEQGKLCVDPDYIPDI
jgi:hypothetical protein